MSTIKITKRLLITFTIKITKRLLKITKRLLLRLPKDYQKFTIKVYQKFTKRMPAKTGNGCRLLVTKNFKSFIEIIFLQIFCN